MNKKNIVDPISSKNLAIINLEGNLLTEISFRVVMSKLIQLNLNSNKIKTFDTHNLVNLTDLSLKDNQLTEFKCKSLLHLEKLKLRKNKLKLV